MIISPLVILDCHLIMAQPILVKITKKSSQRTDYKNDFDPELKSDFIFMP